MHVCVRASVRVFVCVCVYVCGEGGHTFSYPAPQWPKFLLYNRMKH